MFRMLGISDFPYGIVLVWIIVGLLVGLGVKRLLFANAANVVLVYVLLGLVGASVGGLLGLGYYTIVAVENPQGLRGGSRKQ